MFVLPWSLLIRGILAAFRQSFHLSTCPNLVPTTSRFNYTFVDNLAQPAPIPVQIAADGTFRGQIQYSTDSANQNWVGVLTVWATVTGRINGTTIEATVADFRCTRQLMLQRR